MLVYRIPEESKISFRYLNTKMDSPVFPFHPMDFLLSQVHLLEYVDYSIRSGEMAYSFNVGSYITSTSIRQTGNSIAVGLENGSLILWDCRTQQVLNNSPLFQSSITSVAFHPIQSMLLASSTDG